MYEFRDKRIDAHTNSILVILAIYKINENLNLLYELWHVYLSKIQDRINLQFI